MRRWLEQDEPQPGQMAGWVDEILDAEERKALEDGDGAVRWRTATDRDEVREFVRECVTRLEPLLYQVAVPSFDWQPAVRFSTPVRIPGLRGEPVTVLLVGEMDLLCRYRPRGIPTGGTFKGDENRFFVWDLKATKDGQYWRKTVAQLVFYDLAVMSMLRHKTELVGLLQPMVEGQPVVHFAVTDDQRREMMARIIRCAHDIWRGDESPQKTALKAAHGARSGTPASGTPRRYHQAGPPRGRGSCHRRS
jgi:hypothetical protein